jgi:hypothetical protein
MSPKAKGVAAEPAPQSGAADLSDQALRPDRRRISSIEGRDKGSPRVWGSSQASALTWTTRLPESGLYPASRLRLQAGQSGQGESLAPFADDLTGRIQTRRDNVIGPSQIGEEDDLSANHIAIR